MPLRLLYLLLFLILPGCESLYKNPTFYPAGYMYHDGIYKAPPGRNAADLGYTYSAEKNAEIMRDWEAVAADLLGRAEEQGLFPQPVYIDMPAPRDAFTASFDYALRMALTERGYSFTPEDRAQTVLKYGSYLPPEQKETETPLSENTYLLALSTFKNGAAHLQVAHIYELPPYGFDPSIHTVFEVRAAEKEPALETDQQRAEDENENGKIRREDMAPEEIIWTENEENTNPEELSQ